MTAPTTEEGGTGTIMEITVGGEGYARIAWGLRSHGFGIPSLTWGLLQCMGVQSGRCAWGARRDVAWRLWVVYEAVAWLPAYVTRMGVHSA